MCRVKYNSTSHGRSHSDVIARIGIVNSSLESSRGGCQRYPKTSAVVNLVEEIVGGSSYAVSIGLDNHGFVDSCLSPVATGNVVSLHSKGVSFAALHGKVGIINVFSVEVSSAWDTVVRITPTIASPVAL